MPLVVKLDDAYRVLDSRLAHFSSGRQIGVRDRATLTRSVSEGSVA